MQKEFDKYHARFQYELDEVNYLYATVTALRNVSKNLPAGENKIVTDILCAIVCIKTHLHAFKNKRALVDHRNYYLFEHFDDWIKKHSKRLHELIVEFEHHFTDVDMRLAYVLKILGS